MSDTNRVSLRAVEESAYGVIPATPDFETIPIASAPNLAFTPATVVSELLRDDRQISDLPLVGGSAGGDSNSELAFGIYDTFLEGAFFSQWQARLKWHNRLTVDQITAVDADSYTVADLGSAVSAGDLVFAEGFTNAANNGLKVVDAGPTNTDVPVVGAGMVVETPSEFAKLSYVGVQAATSDIVATLSPDTLTSTILDFTTLGLEAGDWLLIQGFSTTTEDNDYVRIVSVAANILTVDRVPTGWAADSGSGDTVQLFLGERIKNGTTKRSYALEMTYNDHNPVTFSYLLGMITDGFTFTAQPQAIVTSGATFLGSTQFYSDSVDQGPGCDGTGRFAGAVTISAPRFQVYNSSSNVGRIARNGVVISGLNFVTEASISIANNLREKPAVGVLGAADVGSGEFGVTGSLQTYFDDKSLAVDVVNNAESSFDIRFRDAIGRAQLWDVPRLKFSEGSPEVPGKNDDVTIPLQYQGILDETLGYTLKLMRFHHVPV